MVTTTSAAWTASVVSLFGNSWDRSMSHSAVTSRTAGLISSAGADPAEGAALVGGDQGEQPEPDRVTACLELPRSSSCSSRAGGQPTALDHLGVEVETTEEVLAATTRLSGLGLVTRVEIDTTCCPAGQGVGPRAVEGALRGYTVKADAPDATSIRPVGDSPGASCECGTPVATT
jgi:hypothetical protein